MIQHFTFSIYIVTSQDESKVISKLSNAFANDLDFQEVDEDGDRVWSTKSLGFRFFVRYSSDIKGELLPGFFHVVMQSIYLKDSNAKTIDMGEQFKQLFLDFGFKNTEVYTSGEFSNYLDQLNSQ